MASVYATSRGQFSIQYKSPRGRRETVYLGRVNKRFAEEFCRRLETLVEAIELRQTPDRPTSNWLAELAPKYRAKLAEKNLCETTTVATLHELCRHVVEHADVEPSTLVKYRDCQANLENFFGAERLIHHITSGDAEEFRRWLKRSGRRPTPGPLAETTVSSRCKQAKQFFALAVKKRWLHENPFGDLRGWTTENRERMFFVTQELTKQLMEETPDLEFKLLIALARYGGLRIPSDALPLRWDWVDWDPAEGQLRILSTKTKRHEHKRWRYVPLFPELRAALQASFHAAEEGADYMITRYRRVTSTSLRNRLERLCRRCGVAMWDKPWQNMRSSRETELMETYPIHVVTQWLGNSPAVAIRHYGQVTKEHLARGNADGSAESLQSILPKST